MPVLAQIFYNFGSVSVSAYKDATQTAMSIAKNLSGPPVTNFRYNDVSYYLRTMYLYHQNGKGPWVVFEAVTDPNGSADGDTMYVAAKIKTGATANRAAPLPLDQLLNSTKDRANAVPVAWDINQDIAEGNKGFLSVNSQLGTKTLVLYDNAHHIRTSLTASAVSKSKCFNHTPSKEGEVENTIRGFMPETLPASSSNEDQANVTITKSILDWNITCELQGEDEASEETVKSDKDLSSQQILGAMSGIAVVAILMYMYVPSFFGAVMVPVADSLRLNSASSPPYKSLSYFWNILLGALMLQSFSFGVSGHGVGFFYVFFGILIVGFLCNKSITEYNAGHNNAWINNAGAFDLLLGNSTRWPMLAFLVGFFVLWGNTWTIGTEGKFFGSVIHNKMALFLVASGLILALAITFLLWLASSVGKDIRNSALDFTYVDMGKWVATVFSVVFISATGGLSK